MEGVLRMLSGEAVVPGRREASGREPTGPQRADRDSCFDPWEDPSAEVVRALCLLKMATNNFC
jgi:hypothetical protein